VVLLKNRKYFIIVIPIVILVCVLFIFVNDSKDETILVKIGEKEISVKEFLLRSELTIRPNNFKNKQTTLNNLISEKILALESGKTNVEALTPLVQLKLKGIREQLMRDKLYYEVAYNEIDLDSNEINNNYKLSMREYALEFFTIGNTEMARKIEATLDSLPERADDMFNEVEAILGKRPIHRIGYNDPDDEVIHDALFSQPVKLGAIIGPKQLGTGDYIIMKVLNWVDFPLVNAEDQNLRLKKVKEKLHRSKAGKLWQSYQASVMKGKRIEFDKQSFRVMSDLAMDKYLNSDGEDSLYTRISEISYDESAIDFEAPFFLIDNKQWTIDDFKIALIAHPLVFRIKNLTKSNFDEQFKLAVVDMIRDYYLTREAYQRSLDKSADINRTVEMWKDAYLAQDQKKQIITSALQQGIIRDTDKPGMLDYWQGYLKELQHKYSDEIRVNYSVFNTISLTKIDFYAIRPGVPYPFAVPGFPTLISSQDLYYAKKVNQFN
jgi:hypothetical protein